MPDANFPFINFDGFGRAVFAEYAHRVPPDAAVVGKFAFANGLLRAADFNPDRHGEPILEFALDDARLDWAHLPDGWEDGFAAGLDSRKIASLLVVADKLEKSAAGYRGYSVAEQFQKGDDLEFAAKFLRSIIANIRAVESSTTTL